MRSVLLHVANDDSLQARTQVALDLARAFGGHLTCLHAVPYEYGVPGDIYGSIVVDLITVVREGAEKLRGECESRFAGEDVPWTWVHDDGRALEPLLRMSALSDIVVVGSREPFSTTSSLLARDLATRLKTPMMLVPEDSKRLDVTGTAVVAWNGSVEASHALKASVPLLAMAGSVVLVSVTGETEGEVDLPAIEGAEYLSRWGIECEMVEIPAGQKSIAEVLSDAASMRNAAYLVMGAYGHMRMVEAVMGGVTRDLFAKPSLPIFTCH